jgi:hypothetical protein
MHLKGRLSIDLVVMVVILLLDSENFLVCEEDVFMPILGVPLEETFCSCLYDVLQSWSQEMSL